MELIKEAQDEIISDKVLKWYKVHGRDLPWRHTHDPYKIWVSEIMLQQTQVDTVIPYYERFISRFPDVGSLSSADIQEVYKYWEGLGYYRRAANLHTAACQIMQEHHGIFPDHYDVILQLKGIGPYTASAVASIAFEEKKGVVDGNTLRIISRLYAYEDNIALDRTKARYQLIMDRLAAVASPSYFNQAMMDIGAMVCRPVKPECPDCPLSDICRARNLGRQAVLPVNLKNIKKTANSYITAVLTYKDSYMMLRNGPGLLENLYGFVQFECGSPIEFEKLFQQQFNTEVHLKAYIKDIKHVFTHKTWLMHVYAGELVQPVNELFTLEEIGELPVSTAHLKVFKAYLKSQEVGT